MENWILDERNTLFRCPACGHILRDLQACPANARRHAWGGVGLFDRIRNSLTFRSMASKLRGTGTGGNLSVLEIGFGSGLLLAKSLAKGWIASGIEAESLDIPINETVKSEAALIYGKIEETGFAPDSFDLIYAVHVAEHLDDPAQVFAKCHSMLKPGGMLYLMTPNADSLGLRWFKSAWWNLEDPTHVRFFSPGSITRMLEDAGYTAVSVKIPAWDSIMVEANSVLRKTKSDAGEHGILSHKLIRVPVMLLAAPFLLVRLLAPRLSPSMEITAVKGRSPQPDCVQT